jgi:hypothetical protein
LRDADPYERSHRTTASNDRIVCGKAGDLPKTYSAASNAVIAILRVAADKPWPQHFASVGANAKWSFRTKCGKTITSGQCGLRIDGKPGIG